MVAVDSKEWGFYGRSVEMGEIEQIIGSGRWFFCSISGRRRIGKTTLIQRAIGNRRASEEFRAVYFQIPDSDERGVLQSFQDALEDHSISRENAAILGHSFQHMAETIARLCDVGFIIVLDEFQYFHRQQLAPFTSYLQAHVDRLRDTDKGGLFVLGSIHTEMSAILDDRHSPLFNRITDRIELGHWDFATLFEMFDAHEVRDPEQRLFLWSLFEGVPKFYRDCHNEGVLRPHDNYRTETLKHLFFEGSSPLRDDATNWFLRELRGRYDSVLKLLAKQGTCTYGELMDEYARAGSGGKKHLSAYLTALTDKYNMVEKRLPIFAGPKARKGRYEIADNFLNAWLKALERAVQFARIRPVNLAVHQADTRLREHEGFVFEKMIRMLSEECSRKDVGDFPLTSQLTGYWNKADGSDIEIDLVALNEESKTVRFGSCKRNATKHGKESLDKFDEHIAKFLKTKDGRRLADWKSEKALYSPVFSQAHRGALERQGYICRDLNDFATFLGRPPPKLFD
jgi:AAA+ ATPase superfamily predicted ATPase